MYKFNKETKREAIRDFFGADNSVEQMPIFLNMTKIKNRPTLSEEQRDALSYIRENLADKGYRQDLEEFVHKSRISKKSTQSPI